MTNANLKSGLIIFILIFNLNSFGQTKEVEYVLPLPYADVPPIYPGCEELDSKESRTCFIKTLNKYVIDNFYYPEDLKNSGIIGRVIVSYEIGVDGKFKNLKPRSRNIKLNDAAMKILINLPKVKPAVHEGKEVAVKSNMVIMFKAM